MTYLYNDDDFSILKTICYIFVEYKDLAKNMMMTISQCENFTNKNELYFGSLSIKKYNYIKF